MIMINLSRMLKTKKLHLIQRSVSITNLKLFNNLYSKSENIFIETRTELDFFFMSYEILNTIGQGTYGVVYRAQNSQNKEIVALKLIKFENRQDGLPNTAIREIALLKELKHPCVIQLYDVIHSQHQLTLIFEYCEWDLNRYMQNYLTHHNNEQSLNVNQVISLSHQLLSALAYIHQNSIIHRDVKPQNLLINRNLELKLADFGLARSTYIPVDPNSISTEVVTQWYRPPEILLDIHNYSFPVDIWSAGCVIVEMLTGQPLFPCNNNEEMLNVVCQLFGYEKMVEAFPDHINQLEPSKDEKGIELTNYLQGYDPRLVNLASKLLEPDPTKRITAEMALKHSVFHNLSSYKMNEKNLQKHV